VIYQHQLKLKLINMRGLRISKVFGIIYMTFHFQFQKFTLMRILNTVYHNKDVKIDIMNVIWKQMMIFMKLLNA